jgi:beta-glucosidase
MKEKPLYPFGFGLSYTTFQLDSLALSADTVSAGDSVKAAVKVSNIGLRDAEEVVQIYIAKDGRTDDDPSCSLRAFSRVAIQAGKQATVEFELPSSAFESVNSKGESVLVSDIYTVIAADAAPLAVSVEKGAAKPVSAKITVK